MLPTLDRTARDAAYLTFTLLTSIAALAVWIVALTVSLTFGILVIGLPIVLASVYLMRWTAELDRQNAALVFGRPVRGHYRSHRAPGLFSRVFVTLRDPQVWRDLAWLITHSVVGMAFGALAVSLIVGTLGTATLPLWYWAVPGGYELGAYTVDTFTEAVLTMLLAVPFAFITVWVMRGMAKFHASLAVELLGRY
ncbi:sensor domain-containing protein [Solirubrobacter sp. CPCC 204708]|uniref:Sensor domain-containing protein n=1 Tax=Solirubrobacter deserti TaxID=2282478 RepID=A0ABT4RH87_9ACTN|nr:sensor domain-containing protein [Solirubrobacter deserti]MBE2315210.1 sensor domain-containing protein [Solirubrobacter deserti]MDA0137894.1 sensor domain-containing protein [Solirubrobacter deserti]